MMDIWHGYLGLQNLGLTPGQARTIWDQFKRLGPGADRSPARRCHWRASLDQSQIILEAAFNPAQLTIHRTKERLGEQLGIDAPDIDHEIQTVTIAGQAITVVSFRYAGADRLRVATFGALDAPWEASRQAALAYIAANSDEWEAAVGGPAVEMGSPPILPMSGEAEPEPARCGRGLPTAPEQEDPCHPQAQPR